MIITRVGLLDLISQLGRQTVVEYEAENKTIEAIVDDLLAFQVLTPAITKGTISNSIKDLTRSIQVSGDTIQRALYRLQETVGGYIEVNNDHELNWLDSIGQNLGQEVRYRKNLKGIERDMDFSSLVNKLYCYGAGEGTARIKLSDAEGQAEDYVEDEGSQTEWGGIYKGIIVNRSITHPDTLLAYALLKLEELKNPVITYRVDAVDLSQSEELNFSFEALQLGSIIKVLDEDLGIDVSVKVVKIEHPNLLKPQEMTLELANRSKDITDTLTEVYDAKQLQDHVATKIGAGQVIIKGTFSVIDWVTEGETYIKGGYIRTGLLESTNWGAAAGSQFNLDDGTFKLGGSASPKLSWNGTALSVQGHIVATSGEFTGTLKTSNIEAGKTLTVLGTISAGGGLVWIDAAGGINVKAHPTQEYTTYLNFYDKNGGKCGYLSSCLNDHLHLDTISGFELWIEADGQLNLMSNATAYLGGDTFTHIACQTGDIRLSAISGAIIPRTNLIRPYSNNATDLGSSSYKLKAVYAVNVYQGDSIFTNDWRLTETKDNKGIRLLRPDGSVAQEWR